MTLGSVSILEAISPLASQGIPAFCGTRRLITAFIEASHLSLSYPPPPRHSVSLRSIGIFSYHLCRGLPSCCFLQFTIPKACMHFYLPHTRCRPGHNVLLNLVTFKVFDVTHKSWSSALGSFFQFVPLRCVEGYGGEVWGRQSTWKI
jgi:hypothetical protein